MGEREGLRAVGGICSSGTEQSAILAQRTKYSFLRTSEEFHSFCWARREKELLGSHFSPEFVSYERKPFTISPLEGKKSHVALAATYRVTQDGPLCLFVTAVHFPDYLVFGESGWSAEANTDGILAAGGLVSDSMGYLSPRSDAANLPFRAVNARNLFKQVRVFTTKRPSEYSGGVLYNSNQLGASRTDCPNHEGFSPQSTDIPDSSPARVVGRNSLEKDGRRDSGVRITLDCRGSPCKASGPDGSDSDRGDRRHGTTKRYLETG